MKTKRLVVRKFRDSDILDLYTLLSDVDVMRYLEPPYSLEQTEMFLKKVALQETPLIYAVDDWKGHFIGYVIYHEYNEDSYEIGWVLHKKEWHKGYAQELTEAMVEDASIKIKNLVIECVPEQIATKRIALNHGFQFLGHENNCDIYKLTLI